MHASVLLLIGSLFYLILTMIIYFGKERVKTEENKVYKYILIVSFIGIILDLFGIYASLNIPDTSIIRFLALKSYYQYLITILVLFSIYIFLPSLQKTKNKGIVVKYLAVIYGILSFFNIILPFKFYRDGNIIYAEGLNTLFLYGAAGIVIIIWLIYILINFRKINIKRLLPIIIFIIFSVPVIYFQMLNPGSLLVTALITFITVYMYYTIENPDIKMISELEKNRALVESSLEDKSLFLFKMSQDIKQPLNSLSSLIKYYNNQNLTKKEIDDNYKMIEAKIDELNFIVKEIVNISDMDLTKVKITNTSYKVDVFFKTIKKMIDEKVKIKKMIEFRYNISKNIPNELYGDYIKLKQALITILNNSIKYTDEGFIELDVDSITRYDLCRLIIKIRDTGCGMGLIQINDILKNNYEFNEDEYEKLDKLNLTLETSIKLIRLLGGNIHIKSDLNHGTEVTIILDQKIKINNSIKQVKDTYNNFFSNKILIVNDDSNEINRIVKQLSKYDIEVNIAVYGKDCIEKIKTGEKYKLILMDDEMVPDNALPTLKSLKKIKKFNTPVVVMLNKEKEFIKEHYLDDGFSDYLLKDKMNNELERIANKYL